MKNIIVSIILAFCFTTVWAQDIIVKMNGDELKAKVTEITLTDIIYKNPDSLQKSPVAISKKEVFMVKYANGTKEIISPVIAESNNAAGPNASPEIMYNQGQADARMYYKGNEVFWGSAGASLLLGYGLVVPITIGFVKPKINPSEVPDKMLLQNEHYVRGYEKQAYNRKIGKAAAGAGVGTLTGTVLYSLILITVLSSYGH